MCSHLGDVMDGTKICTTWRQNFGLRLGLRRVLVLEIVTFVVLLATAQLVSHTEAGDHLTYSTSLFFQNNRFCDAEFMPVPFQPG